jgi:uncharacterized protein with HEPN domain
MSLYNPKMNEVVKELVQAIRQMKNGKLKEALEKCKECLSKMSSDKKKLDASDKKIFVKILVTAACIHKEMKNYEPYFYCISEAAYLIEQKKEFFAEHFSNCFEPLKGALEKFEKELKELKELMDEHENYPVKTKFLDENLQTFDTKRICHIQKVLNFLNTYVLEAKKYDESMSTENFFILNTMRIQTIELVKYIGLLLLNLSGKFRGENSQNIETYGITWIGLEYFCRLVSDGYTGQIFGLGCGNYIKEKDLGIIYFRYFQEIKDAHIIVDEALFDVLEMDLPVLIDIFSNHKNIANSKGKKLTGIKILNELILSGQTINEIDNIIFDVDIRKMQVIDDHIEYFKPKKIDFTAKFNQHYFLRKLQKIGELVTIKRLPKSVRNFDPTTDWELFTTIRDILIHSEKNSTQQNLQNILQDNLGLLDHINQEISDKLPIRMLNLIKGRDSLFPVKFYNKGLGDNNAKKFWDGYFTKQKLCQDSFLHSQRISDDDYNTFWEIVKDVNFDPNDRAKLDDLLCGKTDLPNSIDLGKNYLTILPKGMDKIQRKAAVAILKKAREETFIIEQKKIQIPKAFEIKQDEVIPFQYLKKLKIELSKEGKDIDDKERLLNCVYALDNIKEFLEGDLFLGNHFGVPCTKWNMQDKDTVMNISVRIFSEITLKMAIEYNASQFFQNLDILTKNSEIEKLFENYENLRIFRNFALIHGNHVLDAKRYESGKKQNILDHVEIYLVPIMIDIITNKLELLKKLIT